MNKILKRCLIVSMLIAFISMINYCSAPYDTETAKSVSIRKTITGSGFILRKETVISQSANGVFEVTAKDGERISRGSSVGVAISGNLNDALANELSEVTTRIEEIQQSGSFADIYSSDEARIYTALKDFSASIRNDVYSDNYSSATTSAMQLAALLSKKYAPENGLAADKLLLDLRKRKYELEQQLGGIREDVKAPASGIFFRNLDGLEDSGTEEDIAMLSAEKINGFSKKLENYTPKIKDVAKITDTYVWYLTASVDKDEAQKLTVGKSVTISIDDSAPVEARVLAVNHKEGEDEAAVIIKSTRNVTDVFEKRTAEFEICYEEYSGLYVPAAAIRVVDNVTGVHVISRTKTVTFKCVDILHKEKDYYIVRKNYTPPEKVKYSPLKLYDDILVNPEVVN